MSLLKNKNIVLGVSGGIASYKSPDLVRRLREQGADVQVVMTRGAQEFVTPLTFQAVSGKPVRGELFDRDAEAAMGHIELARWADAVVVAPASANFMARLAQGRADDLLTTLCLATAQPVCIAPSMNRVMWADAATVANAHLLASRHVVLMGPAEGDQACGEQGAGRMLEPLDIVVHLEQMFAARRASGPLSGVRVMITAGPTRERLDPVRYLSNRSSGKTGFALADAAVQAGAEVVLVAGPVQLQTPDEVQRVDVESAEQMLEAVESRIAEIDIFIAAAAVADFRPAAPSDAKIKKSGEQRTLALEPCPDILSTVGHRATPPFTVGFAAETNDIKHHALGKLQKKKLDMIAANRVGDPVSDGECVGFDADENELLVLWDGGEQRLGMTSKNILARQLIDIVAARYKMSR
ncbi:MAG: bifunctional phosphopantothenoylcysteine decarboxylase/phosphopantothenate--cysteine ligase CoaBC [Gammaproteobacteria bacterium]|nr:bifunctional phosphopantothenoylcysteine decarboxylase/phosphopantothenate--cysteine ligase CoaBC [Gammaproteobacteria bacterium]